MRAIPLSTRHTLLAAMLKGGSKKKRRERNKEKENQKMRNFRWLCR